MVFIHFNINFDFYLNLSIIQFNMINIFNFDLDQLLYIQHL